MDSKGQVVENKLLTTASAGISEVINLNGQPAGLYFLKISSSSKLLGTKKIIIQ